MSNTSSITNNTVKKKAGNHSWIKHSLRLLQHESKRGELTIVFFAIVLAVATVFSLSGFSNHINNGLEQSSANFIAADKVLKSSREVSTDILEKSRSLGLNDALQVEMNSMVFAGDNMQLTSIKAVSSLYPLRGSLLISDSLINDVNNEATAKNQPNVGEIWLEPFLFNKLNIAIGDTVEIGVKSFTATGVIKSIPDASFSVFNSGPTVIFNIDDLEGTALIQPASRVTYKYLFAGDESAIEELSDWVKPYLNETQRWYDIKSTQSPLARALERAEKYLSLASMLGIILAAVAVSVATRRYSERNQPIVATLKALGASLSHIRKLYILHWTLLSVISIATGMLLGYLLMILGLDAIAEKLQVDAGGLSSYPFFVAILTGCICSIAFAITPFSQLFSIPALAVIRGNKAQAQSISFTLRSFIHLAIPVAALFGLLVLFSQNVLLSLALLGGGFVVCFVLALLANVFIHAGRSIGTKASSPWHLAIANLKRRANQNVVQLISFTVAIKLLLLILVMKNSLMNDWQAQLPEQTANRFLVNIAEYELPAVGQFIEDNSIRSSDLYPIVLGRVVAVNDELIDQSVDRKNKEKNNSREDGSEESGRSGVGRELNLTWKEQLPENNEITAGSWWPENSSEYLVSVEERLADRLDLNLGDNITVTIGSESLTAKITSFRDVNWQSLQPNFFMIFNGAVLKDFPATYIASMHIPKTDEKLFQQLLSAHPTISTINIEVMLNKLRGVIEQVAVAIGLILILVVIAGSLVLVAQVQASMEEREREIAILRTLGAKGRLLSSSVLFEFVALGAIAGAMASIAMESAVYILQVHIFDMKATFHFEYWLLGIVSGALFVGIVGFLSCRRLLKLDSVTLIRRTL